MIYRLVFLTSLLATVAFAQGASQGQMRLIFHEEKELSSHWSFRGWLIGNAVTGVGDNINLLGGVGYQRKSWWLEAMVQRQWNGDGGQWFADFRFAGQMNPKWSVYLEAAPFLDRSRLYTTGFVERAVNRDFALGVETENVTGAGADSRAVGLRVSKSLPARGNFQPELAVAWYGWSNQPGVLRVYLVLHHRTQ